MRRSALPREDTLSQLYDLRGAAALRHLVAVAASLDSMVVGEPQVLGQVRMSHAAATQAGTMGPVLERAMQTAYVAAKRVRSDTQIARGPVSIASSAVQIARDLHHGAQFGFGVSGRLEVPLAGRTFLDRRDAGDERARPRYSTAE